MAYLITKDYYRAVQPTELNSLTSFDESIRKKEEQSVEAEMKTYLSQKYDLSAEITETNPFSLTEIYKAGSRVYLTAEAYDKDYGVYAPDDLALYNGNVYICNATIAIPEAFNSGKWDLIGAEYEIFYVTMPAPRFDELKYYYKDDQVFWKDKVYVAQKNSPEVNHESAIQAISLENLRIGNILPDDKNTAKAQQMWGVGTAFSVTGILPTDTSVWTKGDNRNQYFVHIYLDMVLFHLCKRISPNNIPVNRVINYMGDAGDRVQSNNGGIRFPLYSALGKLQELALGNIKADLPYIEPRQGSTIRYGGKVRKEYDY